MHSFELLENLLDLELDLFDLFWAEQRLQSLVKSEGHFSKNCKIASFTMRNAKVLTGAGRLLRPILEASQFCLDASQLLLNRVAFKRSQAIHKGPESFEIALEVLGGHLDTDTVVLCD